jgi:iron complex outermembrane recepter protein
MAESRATTSIKQEIVSMAHKQRTHHHSTRATRAAAARVQTALSATSTEQAGVSRHRFVWNFLASLSALALGVYHPAMPSEVRAEDWKPTPREPERDRDPFGTRTDPRNPWRSDRNTDISRSPVPTIRLAANDELQSGSKQRFDIPAGELESALITFSRQTGIQSMYPSDLVAGRRTRGVQGDYTPEEALHGILSGTGLQHQFSDAKTVVLQLVSRSEDIGPLDPATPQAETKPVRVPEIVVKEKKQIDYSGKYDIDDGFKAEYQSSATKTPLSLRQTPQSVSVITRDSLDARFARDQGSALEQAAGVIVSGGPGLFAGRPGAFDQRFVFRGVLLDESLNIREDGFVVPGDRFSPDLAVYERIEVVKGPASTLYGAGEAGGFLNRVRKKPLPEPRYQANLTGGSYGLFRSELDATGPLNQSKSIRGRMIAAYERGDSFVNGVKSDVFVLAPSIEADITQTTRLLGQFLYQKDRFVPNYGTPLLIRDGEFVAPNIPRSQLNNVATDLSQNGNEVYSGTLQADQKLTGDWLANLRFNYNRVKHKSFADRYGYTIAANGDTSIYSGFDDNVVETYSGEFRLNGNFRLLGRQHHILTGGELEHRRDDRQFGYNYLGIGNFYAANFASFPALDKSAITGTVRDSTFTRTRTGGYGQLLLNPVDRLKVLLGGRYDFSDQQVRDNAAGTIGSGVTDSAFTGRTGLTYDLWEHASAYGTVAQSFNPVTAQDSSLNILPPVRGLLYEVGLKTEWLDRRLGINAAIFRLDRENVPIPDPNNNRFNIAGGLQRNDGFELEVIGRPLPGWNLSVAGTLLDAEYIDSRDPNFGNRPRFTSPWQLGAFTTYELQSGPLKGFGFGGGVFAIGERQVRDDRDESIDGYHRVDLTTFYNGFKNVKISVFVRNVLNENYIERPLFASYRSQYGAPVTVAARVQILYW